MATNVQFGDVTSSGAATATMIGQQNNHYYSNDGKENILKALKAVNPQVQRNRIMARKGRILQGSCDWVIHHDTFKEWRCNPDAPNTLLVEGGPGKGKTMIMEAAIRELSTHQAESQETSIVAYFFCEATNSNLNSATAIIKGLLFSLIDQNPEFTQILVNEAYELEDTSFWTLWTLLSNLIPKSRVEKIYLCIDALDECRVELDTLLQASITLQDTLNAKWLVTTREEPLIHRNLVDTGSCLYVSLDGNQDCIDKTLEHYVRFKTDEIARVMKYQPDRKTFVHDYLLQHAQGTFLWVALACEMLSSLKRRADVEKHLTEIPAGLTPLYERMLQQIGEWNDEDGALLCKSLLRTLLILQQPPTVADLGILSNLPQQFDDDLDAVEELIKDCGSFLQITGNSVYFVHQSAIDFLAGEKGVAIHSKGTNEEHYRLTDLLIHEMSKRLKNDICEVKWPGIVIDYMPSTRLDAYIPSVLQYACKFWVQHLIKAHIGPDDLFNEDKIHTFLQRHLLHWFEALGWMEESHMADSMLNELSEMMAAALSSVSGPLNPNSSNTLDLLEDAQKFMATFQRMIEMVPLQLYASALTFAPKNSCIKQTFHQDSPSWIKFHFDNCDDDWSSARRTYVRHDSDLNDVAWSPDGKFIASAADDRIVCVWDPFSGNTHKILTIENDPTKVAFSSNGELLAVGSTNLLKVYKVADASLLYSVDFSSDSVDTSSFAFSPDGKWLAKGDLPESVSLLHLDTFEWRKLNSKASKEEDINKSQLPHTRISFSSCGRFLLATSGTETPFLWDMELDEEICYPGLDTFWSVTLSPSSPALVCLSKDTVMLQDLEKLMPSYAFSVDVILESGEFKLSYDENLFAYVANGRRLKVVNVKSQETLYDYRGDDIGFVFEFSPDSNLLAWVELYSAIHLVDCVTGHLKAVLNRRGAVISSIVFCPVQPTLFASASSNGSVELWDISTSTEESILPGFNSAWFGNFEISRDRTKIAGLYGSRLVLWDLAKGTRLDAPLAGQIRLVRFYPRSDHILFISQRSDTWAMNRFSRSSQTVTQLFSFEDSYILDVHISENEQLVAVSSHGQLPQLSLWDLQSGEKKGSVEGRGRLIRVAFSPNSEYLVFGSAASVSLFLTETFSEVWSVDLDYILDVVFSPCGQFLAIGCDDEDEHGLEWLKIVKVLGIPSGQHVETQSVSDDSLERQISFTDDSQLKLLRKGLDFDGDGGLITFGYGLLMALPVQSDSFAYQGCLIKSDIVIVRGSTGHATILQFDIPSLLALEEVDDEAKLMQSQLKSMIGHRDWEPQAAWWNETDDLSIDS